MAWVNQSSLRSQLPARLATEDIQEWEHYHIPAELIEFVSILSTTGASGQVWRARYKNRQVAVKCISLSATEGPALEALKRETVVLLHIAKDCRHACKFFGVTVKDNSFCIVMKLYPSNLSKEIAQSPGSKLTVRRSLQHGIVIAKAVAELHMMGVIICDLKPDNILLDDLGDPVLTDFGLSRVVNSTQRGFIPSSMQGTPNYMSPEQFDPNAVSNGTENAVVTEKADVWAFACTMIHMLTGVAPWGSDNIYQICSKIVMHKQSPTIPGCIPSGLSNLLARCLQLNPSLRPSAKELLEALTDCMDALVVASSVSQTAYHDRYAASNEAGCFGQAAFHAGSGWIKLCSDPYPSHSEPLLSPFKLNKTPQFAAGAVQEAAGSGRDPYAGLLAGNNAFQDPSRANCQSRNPNHPSANPNLHTPNRNNHLPNPNHRSPKPNHHNSSPDHHSSDLSGNQLHYLRPPTLGFADATAAVTTVAGHAALHEAQLARGWNPSPNVLLQQLSAPRPLAHVAHDAGITSTAHIQRQSSCLFQGGHGQQEVQAGLQRHQSQPIMLVDDVHGQLSPTCEQHRAMQEQQQQQQRAMQEQQNARALQQQQQRTIQEQQNARADARNIVFVSPASSGYAVFNTGNGEGQDHTWQCQGFVDHVQRHALCQQFASSRDCDAEPMDLPLSPNSGMDSSFRNMQYNSNPRVQKNSQRFETAPSNQVKRSCTGLSSHFPEHTDFLASPAGLAAAAAVRADGAVSLDSSLCSSHTAYRDATPTPGQDTSLMCSPQPSPPYAYQPMLAHMSCHTDELHSQRQLPTRRPAPNKELSVYATPPRICNKSSSAGTEVAAIAAANSNYSFQAPGSMPIMPDSRVPMLAATGASNQRETMVLHSNPREGVILHSNPRDGVILHSNQREGVVLHSSQPLSMLCDDSPVSFFLIVDSNNQTGSLNSRPDGAQDCSSTDATAAEHHFLPPSNSNNLSASTAAPSQWLNAHSDAMQVTSDEDEAFRLLQSPNIKAFKVATNFAASNSAMHLEDDPVLWMPEPDPSAVLPGPSGVLSQINQNWNRDTPTEAWCDVLKQATLGSSFPMHEHRAEVTDHAHAIQLPTQLQDASANGSFSQSTRGPQGHVPGRGLNSDDLVSHQDPCSQLPHGFRIQANVDSLHGVSVLNQADIRSSSQTYVDSPNSMQRQVLSYVWQLHHGQGATFLKVLAALGILAGQEANHRLLMRCGVGNAVVKCMQRHLNNVHAVKESLNVLHLLSQNEENDLAILPCVVDTLQYDDKEILHKALCTLRLLCCQESNKTLAPVAGTLPPLIRLLRHSHPAIVMEAAGTLKNLATSDTNKRLIVMAEAVPALVGLLRHDCAPVVEQALWAIINLSALAANRTELVNLEAPRLISNLLQHEHRHPELATAAAAALRCLGYRTD